ncbi:unnamed protein product, partial [Gulo gulo]
AAAAAAGGVRAEGGHRRRGRRGRGLRACEVRAAHAQRTCGAALPRGQGPVPGNASTAAANGPERRAWSAWEAWASGAPWPSWLPRKTRHRKARTPWTAWPRRPPWLFPDGQGWSPRAPGQGWATRTARASGRAR